MLCRKKFEASTHDLKQKQIHSPLTNNQKQRNQLEVVQNTTPQNNTEHVLWHRKKLKSLHGPQVKLKIWCKRRRRRQDQKAERTWRPSGRWPGESSQGWQGKPNKLDPGSFTGESPTHGAAILLSKRFGCSLHSQANKVKQLQISISREGCFIYFFYLFSFTSYSWITGSYKDSTHWKVLVQEAPIQLDWLGATRFSFCPWMANKQCFLQ